MCNHRNYTVEYRKDSNPLSSCKDSKTSKQIQDLPSTLVYTKTRKGLDNSGSV